jgi:integrase
MAARHLTARACASAAPKTGKGGEPVQTAFPDDDPKGLELRVSAEGRKVWCFRYRTLDGRQRRLTLGVFAPGDDDVEPQAGPHEAAPLTLKAARRRARQARAVVETGGDPATAKRRARAAALADPMPTLDALADAYLGACERGEWKPRGRRKRDSTLSGERNILRRNVRPILGPLAPSEITRARVKALLRGMMARGIGAQTNRTHAVIRQVFAWAIAEEHLELNPAAGFRPMADETARARVIGDGELKHLWAAITEPDGLTIPSDAAEPRPLYLSRPVAIVLQLAAILLQRRGEVTGMRRAELDLENGTWTIPAARTKSGKPHLVPLPERAKDLIKEALQIAERETGQRPECVFPGRRDGAKPLRPDSITHALADVCRACGVEGVTVHDLRRTGASAMASERLGIPPFLISRVLGHTADTGGAALVTLQHYTVYDFAPEKRRALEGWTDLLLEVVGERPRTPKMRVIAGGAA